MFNQIQEPFEKHCPKTRKNFLSYSYTLYKFFQLLNKQEYLIYFPLLKSREKLLDKVEKIEAPENSLKGPNFKFLDSPRAGRDILSIKDLTHSYEDNILFLEAFFKHSPMAIPVSSVV